MKDFVVAVVTAWILLAIKVVCFQIFWEGAVPALFPGLVASGAIAAKVSFWNSLVAIWLVDTIFPPRQTKKAE